MCPSTLRGVLETCTYTKSGVSGAGTTRNVGRGGGGGSTERVKFGKGVLINGIVKREGLSN